MLYLTSTAVGGVIALRRKRDASKVFGLGMALPTGGYVASGRPGKGVAVAVGTAVIGVNMLITGNVVLTPSIWATTAIAAARTSTVLRRGGAFGVGASTAVGGALAVAVDRRSTARV